MMPRGAFMPPWPRVFQPDTSTTFSPALRKTLARSVRYIRSPFRGHEKGAPEGAPLGMGVSGGSARYDGGEKPPSGKQDRKSTRLNSSHVKISYAVFCLKKKKTKRYIKNAVLNQH